MRLFNYASNHAIKLWLAAWLVMAASVTGLALADWTSVYAFGVAAALMLQWPLVREVFPVAWKVVVHGRWPV